MKTASEDEQSIRTQRYYPFLRSDATAYHTAVCAVQPDVPILSTLEHAGYILRAVKLLTDTLSSDTLDTSPAQQEAMAGIDYLVQLASGLLDASIDALDAKVSQP